MYKKGIKKLSKDLNLIDFVKTQKNLQTLAKCQNLLTKERLERLEHTKKHLINLEENSSNDESENYNQKEFQNEFKYMSNSSNI